APLRQENLLGPMDDDLAKALTERFRVPFTTDWLSDPRSVIIRMQLPDGVLEVEAPRKRLYTGTIFLFVGWLAGTALLLFAIAALFMRNQVRAIRRLASAAEAPGGGERGPPGRGRLQPDAGTHSPLPGPAHRDAGGRVARPAHTADPAAPGAGHAA